MTLPMLIPVTSAFDTRHWVVVGQGHVEHPFTGSSMRAAWEKAKFKLHLTYAAELMAFLGTKESVRVTIEDWSTLVTADGEEVRALVQFTDGSTWQMTYGRVGEGQWRVRKIHRPR